AYFLCGDHRDLVGILGHYFDRPAQDVLGYERRGCQGQSTSKQTNLSFHNYSCVQRSRFYSSPSIRNLPTFTSVRNRLDSYRVLVVEKEPLVENHKRMLK